MSVGTIRANIKLDRPNHIFSSITEPVTGHVVLTFRPSMDREQNIVTEFFGPMEIRISFHGRLKTKLKKSNGNSSSTYRGRQQVFSRSQLIFKDSAKIARNEAWPVPFECHFPDRFEFPIDRDWEQDPRYDSSPEQPLPPSFTESYYGFATHYDSFVEYRVGVSVRAPHVSVNIIQPEKYSEPLVHYEQMPVPPASTTRINRSKGTTRISNEFLLPEEDRPSGFRQRAKAKMSSDFYPHYNFDWALIAPQEIYLGQPIPFEISIKPRESECTALVVPEVCLDYFSVAITGYTIVRAEKNFFSHPESDHDEQVLALTGRDKNSPFSKGNDWKKSLKTTPLPTTVVSSFRTVNISRRYTMKFTLVFTAAGKRHEYESMFKVTVLPPPAEIEAASGALTGAEAGPSTQQTGDPAEVAEPLPRYDEGLPDYLEAVGVSPVPPAKDAPASETEAGRA